MKDEGENESTDVFLPQTDSAYTYRLYIQFKKLLIFSFNGKKAHSSHLHIFLSITSHSNYFA